MLEGNISSAGSNKLRVKSRRKNAGRPDFPFLFFLFDFFHHLVVNEEE